MKKVRIIKRTVCVICILLLCISMSGCKKEETKAPSLWDDAIYNEDATFGSGAKTFEIEVKAEDKSVTFTIKTDKNNLEEALLEHKLIDGEEGPYGLYVKKVNGMTADYDTDQSYWSLCQDGNPLMTGAGDTAVNGGEHFEFVREK